MARDSVTLEKSKNFAIRIVRLYQYLCTEKREYVLSKQLLRSGTSIGANLSEAIYGISEREFLSKVYISLKECAETKYWLELLKNTEYLDVFQYQSMDSDCTELIKLLTAIAKTMSNKLKQDIRD